MPTRSQQRQCQHDDVLVGRGHPHTMPESDAFFPRTQIKVDKRGKIPGSASSITEALDLAEDGDEILVYPGEYNEALVILHPVEIRGVSKNGDVPTPNAPPNEQVILRSSDQGSAVYFKSDSRASVLQYLIIVRFAAFCLLALPSPCMLPRRPLCFTGARNICGSVSRCGHCERQSAC